MGLLPPKLEMEPVTYMITIIARMCDQFQTYVRGSAEASRLMHHNRAAYAAFKVAIQRTTPNFVACTEVGGVPTSPDLEEEGDEVVSVMKPFTLTDMRDHIARCVYPNRYKSLVVPLTVFVYQGNGKRTPRECALYSKGRLYHRITRYMGNLDEGMF